MNSPWLLDLEMLAAFCLSQLCRQSFSYPCSITSSSSRDLVGSFSYPSSISEKKLDEEELDSLVDLSVFSGGFRADSSRGPLVAASPRSLSPEPSQPLTAAFPSLGENEPLNWTKGFLRNMMTPDSVIASSSRIVSSASSSSSSSSSSRLSRVENVGAGGESDLVEDSFPPLVDAVQALHAFMRREVGGRPAVPRRAQ